MPYGFGFGYGSYGFWGSPWFGCNPLIINTGLTSGLEYQPYQPSATRHFGRFRGAATTPSP